MLTSEDKSKVELALAQAVSEKIAGTRNTVVGLLRLTGNTPAGRAEAARAIAGTGDKSTRAYKSGARSVQRYWLGLSGTKGGSNPYKARSVRQEAIAGSLLATPEALGAIGPVTVSTVTAGTEVSRDKRARTIDAEVGISEAEMQIALRTYDPATAFIQAYTDAYVPGMDLFDIKNLELRME